MLRRPARVVLALALLLVPGAGHAQLPQPLPLLRPALALGPSSPRASPVETTSLRTRLRLDDPTARGTRARTGLVIGAVAGALLGGYALHQFCLHERSADESCTGVTLLGGGLGGLLGAGVGYALGREIHVRPRDEH